MSIPRFLLVAMLGLCLIPFRFAAGQSGVTPEQRQWIEKAIPQQALATPKEKRTLLVIDQNIGRPGHPSIAHANLAIRLMGQQTGAYETEFCHDTSQLDEPIFERIDGLFLNNTIGPLFARPELRHALRNFLDQGGGMAANHAVTVTSVDWDEFGLILGARGAAHRDADERVMVRVEDADSPLTRMFGNTVFEVRDEIFRFQDPYSRSNVRVLLSIDVGRTDMNQGRARGNCVREDNDYPISWVRRQGNGRVFYCSLGHNPQVFWNPKMLEHFLAGIQFVLGDLPADASPSQ